MFLVDAKQELVWAATGCQSDEALPPGSLLQLLGFLAIPHA